MPLSHPDFEHMLSLWVWLSLFIRSGATFRVLTQIWVQILALLSFPTQSLGVFGSEILVLAHLLSFVKMEENKLLFFTLSESITCQESVCI